MGKVERRKRRQIVKRQRKLDNYEDHRMDKLYQESRLDPNTWEGVTHRDIPDSTITNKTDTITNRIIKYIRNWV